nr:IS110 family transposase [Salsipaludibacter albus]
MQDDMSGPGLPVGGIDWATDTNELCIVDPGGEVVHRSTTTMDAAGIRRLVGQLGRYGVGRVGIERPDGPVVEALLGADVEVVVITPRQVKNLRSRYGSAGNKDDRFDAFVLADTVRTDPGRLVALEPDSPQTSALRATVRARTDLVAHRVALCNQLRAHLQIVFPGRGGAVH